MNDPPDPFTSVSSAWLLGSASNCGSVWFTVRKRWKRSANNRLGKLEISSRGGGGDSLASFQIQLRAAGGWDRFKEPWRTYPRPIHPFHLRKQLRVIVSCGWLARLEPDTPAPRHELRLLSTFLAVSRYGARPRNQPLAEKKRRKKNW